MESLLPIVASQRERFKVRNMELEAVGFPLGCTNFVFVLFFVFCFVFLSFYVERYPIVCSHWELRINFPKHESKVKIKALPDRWNK